MQLWDQFLAQQGARIGSASVDKWLRPLRVVHFDAGNLYLEAQHAFQIHWFEEHMRRVVKQSLFNANGRPILVHLSLADEEQLSRKPRRGKNNDTEDRFQLKWNALDPSANFSSFVQAPENLLAFSLLQSMVANTDKSQEYNPLFLHGAASSGKSHLLMATASSLQSMGLRVIYVRGATFAEHVVTAIRAGQMGLFREAYRNAEALLIDDIQGIANKAATQEELFHTFNTLHVAGKQLIFSAHCTPQELTSVEPRLISRFEWGIVAPVGNASRKTLDQIVVKKADLANLSLSQTIREWILDTFGHDPARVMQAITALALAAPADGRLDLARVQSLLTPLMEEQRRATTTPEKVVETVASYYGIQVSDILGKSQRRECSLPRQIAMFLCRRVLRLPFTQIGALFERNHSTVMTSVKQIEKGVKNSASEMTAIVKVISKRLA